MSSARTVLATGIDANGALYAFGGQHPAKCLPAVDYHMSIDRYTASSAGGVVWMTETSMLTSRRGVASVAPNSGRI